MPVSPEMRVTPACAARSATRAVLTSRCSPPLMTASPLESYPRYSSLRMPSMRMGTTFSRATAPTMPHIMVLSFPGPLPTRDRDLLVLRDRKLPGGDLLAYRGACAYRRAPAHGDRRDELR